MPLTADILFMPTSFDYTLIQIYIPWALLVLLVVDARRAGRSVPGLGAVFVCFVLICAPLSEFIYRGSTIEGRVKMFALLALFVIGLRYPSPQSGIAERSGIIA